MARPGLSRAQDQINILLGFPLEQQVGRETVEALHSPDRTTRREALSRIESHEPDYGHHADDAVRRICARVGVRSPSMSLASEESGLHYLSIDDLDPDVGPPEGVPIYNPYTGTLSVYPEPDLDPSEAMASISEAVRADEAVVGVEPVVIYRAISSLDDTPGKVSAPHEFDTAEVEGWQAAMSGEATPWGLDHIGARAAWRRGFAGQGVIVAVVDTGIAPHVDLAPPLRGATLIPGSISCNDDHGHGTHVAGTIAALKGNGAGAGGVSPAARLMAVKVLARDGYSRGDSVAHGITWAANNGARIINLSLGSSLAAEAMRRAVLYARSRGVLICAAAGNDYGGPISYPAAFYDACIAVAATDRSNRKALFGSRGPQLDLSAPGVAIRSTHLANTYREMSGTSMAAPYVAGVAAILLSRHPDLLPMAVQRHLEVTAMPLGAPDHFGRGLVQAERAVAAPPRASAVTGQNAIPAREAGAIETPALPAAVLRRNGARRPRQN